MKKAILATKVGMTQIFNADGVLVPVTVLEAGPCSVTQIKTVENDGYSAVQVPKVKVSRALLRDLDSTEVLWLTVPNSIVIRVPMVHVLHQAVYSKEKECLDIWVA